MYLLTYFTYGLSVGIDVSDLEWRNSPCVVLFDQIPLLWRLITSQWLKVDL